ncbi:MAG: precorrin-6A/cobalt-precorrin-6A reductase [Candidatus Promineifilaceae bacterium]
MRILILGGTEEGRLLADALAGMGHDVVTSFAGRTNEPNLPQGEVRVGGFGGMRGLSDYILNNGIQRVVDATHPYAVQMATNAVEASLFTRVPLVRLVRPAWKEPQYAFWHHVQSAEDAAAGLPGGARVLLTVGHTGLEVFLARTDCSFVVRSIEPPAKAAAGQRAVADRPATLLRGGRDGADAVRGHYPPHHEKFGRGADRGQAQGGAAAAARHCRHCAAATAAGA